jgi:hypothetical protein
MLEMGWEARSFGTQALLQPFAHGVADRSAGLVIDLFAVIGDSAVHDGFRSVSNEVTLNQVIGMEIVSRQRWVACLSSKNCMKRQAVPLDRIQMKSPGNDRAGAFDAMDWTIWAQ